MKIQRVLFKSYRFVLIQLTGELISPNKPSQPIQPNKHRSLNYPKFSNEIFKVTAKPV